MDNYYNQPFIIQILMMPFDVMQDGVFGIVFGLLVLTVYIFAAICILFGLFWVINFVGVESQPSSGTIIQKTYSPARSRLVPTMVGTAMVTMRRNYSEEFHLTAELPNGKADDFSTNKELYDVARQGEICSLRYKKGRLNNAIKVAGIVIVDAPPPNTFNAQKENMDMSSACTAPIHEAIQADDRIHPRFDEYLTYRSAMSAQLVSCPSFFNWLAAQERAVLADAANRHPRIDAYRTWLRENVNCKPAKTSYVDFWCWLDKTRSEI